MPHYSQSILTTNLRDLFWDMSELLDKVLHCRRVLHVALPFQQGSVSATPKAHFRIRTWVAQRTKLCPLSSSQDSTLHFATNKIFGVTKTLWPSWRLGSTIPVSKCRKSFLNELENSSPSQSFWTIVTVTWCVPVCLLCAWSILTIFPTVSSN